MEEKKIIICSEDNNSKKSEFTFKRYLHSIGEYKWWIIAFTLVFMILGYLFAAYVYNPKKQNVSYQFTYDIAIDHVVNATEDETGNVITTDYGYFYVDGTPYSYGSVISEKAVEAVKEKNPDYAGVDTDDILAALSISPVMVNDAVLPFQYVVNCSVSPFKNADNASFFVRQLIEYTKDYSQSLVSTYDLSSYLSSSFSSYSFGQQISALKTQYERVLRSYSGLQNQFPYAFASIQGQSYSLAALSQSFENRYAVGSDTVFQQYEANYSRNKYLNYQEGKEESVLTELYSTRDDELAKLNLIETEIGVYQETIDSLTSKLAGSQLTLNEENILNTSQKKIETLRLSQMSIREQLSILGYSVQENASGLYELIPLSSGQIIYLESLTSDSPTEEAKQWKKDNLSFASLMNQQYQNLKQDSNTASEAYQYLYKKNKNEIVYNDMGTVSGGISKYVVAVGSAVLTFLVSSLICTGLSISSSHKKEGTAAEVKPEEKTEGK